MMILLGRALVVLVAVVGCSGYGGNPDSCLRFGGGSCCPLLNALDRDIKESVSEQPAYIVLLPSSELTLSIDNICQTFFPLPDDSDTYLLHQSIVYNNGFNEIRSLVVSQPETGVRRFGSLPAGLGSQLGRATCQYTDTIFAHLDCNYDVYLKHRCIIYGECVDIALTASPSSVYGFSDVRQPISRACLSKAEAAVSHNGLPDDDYHILPMRLASRCVLNQVCSVATALHRFCQTVGVAFPNINRCANINLQYNF